MIGSARQWFQALSSRERILIGIFVILILLTVCFYGVVRPFASAMDVAEQDFAIAVEREARIKSKIAALNEEPAAKTAVVSGTLDSFLSQSAGEAGFAVGTIDAQSDGSVNMTIKSAKPAALFGWLSRLEQRGISPTIVAATPAANETISASLRMIQVKK